MVTRSVRIEKLPVGVVQVDTEHARQGVVASYIILERGHAAVIETGTGLAASRILRALEALEIRRENVDFVAVTHIHLDHAGGAGALMRALPNASLFVHHRGARHLVDPTRLRMGAEAVYGEDTLRELFGEILPVPADRVFEIRDGDTLALGGRTILVVETPGHSRDHCVFVDEASQGVFAGDAFGVSYRVLTGKRGRFIFPATTPVHFDPEAMHASIERILDQKQRFIYLTHFGRVSDVSGMADAVRRLLDEWVTAAVIFKESGGTDEPVQADLLKSMRESCLSGVRAVGCSLTDTAIDGLLDVDLTIAAQGIETWLNSRRVL